MKLAGVLALSTDLVRHIKKDKSYNCCKLALKVLYGMVRGQEIVYMLTGSGEGNSIAGFLSVNENLVATGHVIAGLNSEARIQRAAKAAKHFNEGPWESKFPPSETWYKKQQIPQ